MKKLLPILCLLMLLAGCKQQTGISLDAIVDIPLHPTEETQQETEPTALDATETIPAQTDATEPATQPKSSGGKTNTKTESGGKKNNTTTKKEPATQPPTEAPTEPPTEPPTEAPTELPTVPVYTPAGYTVTAMDRAVADGVNDQRLAAELDALMLDARLCAIASVRAREAASVWSSTRPDGSDGLSVLDEHGYAWSMAGENLWFGLASADGVVNKWMSVPALKEKLLLADFTRIGVASFTAPDGLTYVAALFVG